MKRLLIAFSAVAAATTTLPAAPVSPDAALSRALASPSTKIRSTAGKYTLVQTQKADGMDAVYLFGSATGNGFLLTPADDSLPAVLGYGSSGICDKSGNFAPGFAYWMEYMARQTAYAAKHPEAAGPRREQPDRDPIEPLCATLWNQSVPYNLLCPVLDGHLSVTGCVATAMSQAMKYHNWPETGEGYNEYEWQNQTLSMDFSAQQFKWDQMLDYYTNVFDGTVLRIDATKEQQDAVAELMRAAGYSVNMGYSPEASGAASMRIAPALGQFFRYDKSLRYLQRDYYSLEDWEEIIYTSLREDGPVIYDGQANIGGHSFICDGYEGNGYFHFNWGWGGMSDGYFLLDALDPINQGIGGADSGFNYMQDVIVNIRPDRTGTSSWSAQMVCDGALNATFERNERVVRISNMIYNAGPGDIGAGYIGVMFKDRVNEDLEPVYMLSIFEGLPIMYGFRSIEFEIPELPDSQYDMIPVYTTSTEEDAEVLTVATPYGKTASYSFAVSNGKVLGFRATEDFRPSSTDGITDSRIQDETTYACEYFTLQGAKVAVKDAGVPRPELPVGIYIVRYGTKKAKIAVR